MAGANAGHRHRARWDQERGAWRIYNDRHQRPMFYWLLRCVRCSREDWRGPASRLCGECSRERYQQLRAVSGPAHRAVAKAIKRGVLPALDGSIACLDCGAAATRYDHRDYSRPLEVEPVCASCNVRRGSARDAGRNVPLKDAHAAAERTSLPIHAARLREAVQQAGSQQDLADRLGLTQSHLSNLLNCASQVRAERVLNIERVTGIPRHELRPDIFPPPSQAA